MPRFVKDGPIVPDRLVQELEEDRVVIFCGAGISIGAGLPDFKGLVAHCYSELGASVPDKKSNEWDWLDRMLGSLEADYPNQMRAKVVERLDMAPRDTSLHEAILKLARLRGPAAGTRLVTTNFDLFFEAADETLVVGRDLHSGPVLPIPSNDTNASWRSIVYLHGRLDTAGGDNRHLVLTSADFGRAYLTDAWAARFVGRLFEEFTVVFIGYSLNDPVLRYMTDAFAAEDALSRSGRKRPPAYLFVSHPGTVPPDPKNWRVRRIEPIFYREAYIHKALRETLIEWAAAREDFQTSVRQIIELNGPRLPTALEPSDAGNVIWAVCERIADAGHGASVFASLVPPAPITWLSAFEQRDADAKRAFEQATLLARGEGREPPRAPPYHIASLLVPSSNDAGATCITEQASHLLPWIVKHLGNRALVDWVISKMERGLRLHPNLRYLIRLEIAANGTLAAGLKIFWQVVSGEGDWMANHMDHRAFFDLRREIQTDSGVAWLEHELRSAMRPYLKFTPRFRISELETDTGRISSIATAEVAFSCGDLFALLEEIPAPGEYWSTRLGTLTEVLRQVLDLFAVVGEADAVYDPTAFSRPSIQPHEHNRHHTKWARLYDLIWQGWLQVDATNEGESRHWIDRWRRIPYLGFRRLVLAAVQHSEHVTPDEKLEALIDG